MSCFPLDRRPSSSSNPAPTASIPTKATNPLLPTTKPRTTIRLPPTLISSYQSLLSLPPTSPLIRHQLSTFPRPLLKKQFRKSFLPTSLTSPFQKLFSSSSHRITPAPQQCDLCPLHTSLSEAPLVHLAGLLSYEMYTHLQSLSALHPSQRSETTNALLADLEPWREKAVLEPGTR
ncbi:MAG: hypothetical protein Q9181_007728, partial [Wetmoreana brouardii]